MVYVGLLLQVLHCVPVSSWRHASTHVLCRWLKFWQFEALPTSIILRHLCLTVLCELHILFKDARTFCSWQLLRPTCHVRQVKTHHVGTSLARLGWLGLQVVAGWSSYRLKEGAYINLRALVPYSQFSIPRKVFGVGLEGPNAF